MQLQHDYFDANVLRCTPDISRYPLPHLIHHIILCHHIITSTRIKSEKEK
jgi:hypothetical protein